MNSCPYSPRGCLRRPENKNNCNGCPRYSANLGRKLDQANKNYDAMHQNNKNQKEK